MAKEELESENWLRAMARFSDRSYEQIRVAILQFLETDVFHVSVENCAAFLDPLIETWDIDLKSFGMEIVLNGRLATGIRKRFEFVEREPEPAGMEPGLEEFLHTTSLSGDATQEEISFLKALKFKERRPLAIYYYRELQNFRDPVHFSASAPPGEAADRGNAGARLDVTPYEGEFQSPENCFRRRLPAAQMRNCHIYV